MAGLFWNPTFSAEQTTYDVNERSTVTLVCKSNSWRGKVEWTRDEKTYSQDDANPNYRIKWNKNEISLTIKCAGDSDAGEYVCEVHFSKSFQKSAAITLNVWNVLRYPEERQTAQAGGSITLRCEVEHPNTELLKHTYWTHNSKKINMYDARYDATLLPSPSLKILKVNDDDAGSYEFRVKGSAYMYASHSNSRRCVCLEVHPKVIPLENKYVAHLHKKITLDCETYGADSCMWKHNADVISTGNRYKINDDMSLTISPVRQSDEGRYVCEVTNRAGISATSEEIELCTMPSDYSKLPSEYSQLSETQLKTNEMEKINILMKEIPDNKTACIYFIGRYGAGKSSAISSFHSVNRGRITTIALPGGGDSSFTREVSCTEIFGGKVKLYDLPGYEGTRQFDGKQFSCISDDTTKANSEGDPPKCIVYVKDCSNQLTEEELEIMKQVHDYVKPRDNLQMVTLLTKIDRASQNAKTIPEMLISQELCTAVEQISGNVQLPVNCIFAMKNYHREMDSDPAIGWLILYTFRSLLDRLLDIHERLRLEKVVHT